MKHPLVYVLIGVIEMTSKNIILKNNYLSYEKVYKF